MLNRNPYVSRRSRRFTQTNNKTSKPHQLQSVFLCVIMQLAAFVCVICVICVRITTQEYSINLYKDPPKSPADPADNRRQNPKHKTATPNSLSLRNNAAKLHSLCVICAICGRITRKSTQSILHQTKPQCLPQISQMTQTNPKTTLTTTCLSLRNNTAKLYSSA